MASIKVVTDSTADIPKGLVEELGITIVPLKVHFGEETFLDGVTLQADEFYEKLPQSTSLPTTSQPSPVDFVDTYKKIQKEEEGKVQIISIHLSSALSGTVQSANLAQSMLEEEIDITVIDSKTASYGIGIIVAKVAEAVKEGKSKEECVALAQKLVMDTGIFFLVNSLEYLQKGGRIGRASAVLGSLLNIKPVLSVNEQGEVYAIDKVRGNKKSIQRTILAVKEFVGGEHRAQLAICHAQAIEEAESLKQQLIQEFPIEDILITNIGPVIGTHVGPKTLGVIVTRV